MSADLATLFDEFDRGRLSRRQLLKALGIADGAKVKVGSRRGSVALQAKAFDNLRRGVLISEGLWPNDAFENGQGINTLTGADQPAPSRNVKRG